ncbi:hypothetical protein N665_0212s0009 [Sinapis alba]|nr:hypothetical protein N665_0212s0009 [Sinapis alba]
MLESQTAPRSQPQSSGWVLFQLYFVYNKVSNVIWSCIHKQALISLSDKNHLSTLGNGLQEYTASTLENAGVCVTKVETLTNSKEAWKEACEKGIGAIAENLEEGVLDAIDFAATKYGVSLLFTNVRHFHH